MWAHYAESHCGICLWFDVEDRLAHEVEYVANRLPMPFNRMGAAFDVSVMHNFFWPILLKTKCGCLSS